MTWHHIRYGDFWESTKKKCQEKMFFFNYDCFIKKNIVKKHAIYI